MAVDVNAILARYDAEIGRLTRRTLIAESEVESLREELAAARAESMKAKKPNDQPEVEPRPE